MSTATIENSQLKVQGNQKSKTVWYISILLWGYHGYIRVLQSKTLDLGPDAGKTYHRVQFISDSHAESIIEEESYIV